MSPDQPPALNNNLNESVKPETPPVPPVVPPSPPVNESPEKIYPFREVQSYAERHFDPKWLICKPEILHEEHYTLRDRLSDKVSINSSSKQPIRLMKSPTPYQEDILMIKLYNGTREKFKEVAREHGTTMQTIIRCFIEKLIEEPGEFEIGVTKGYRKMVRRFYG